MNNLKKIRLSKNISLRKMASLCGMSHMTYYRYEEGINTPKLSNLIKISKALNVSINDLLEV